MQTQFHIPLQGECFLEKRSYSGSCRQSTLRRNWWVWLTDCLTADCWSDSDPHHLMNPAKHAPRLAHCFAECPLSELIKCTASPGGAGQGKREEKTWHDFIWYSLHRLLPAVAASQAISQTPKWTLSAPPYWRALWHFLSCCCRSLKMLIEPLKVENICIWFNYAKWVYKELDYVR